MEGPSECRVTVLRRSSEGTLERSMVDSLHAETYSYRYGPSTTFKTDVAVTGIGNQTSTASPAPPLPQHLRPW